MDETALDRIEAQARRDLFDAAPESVAIRMGVHWAAIGGSVCTAVESAPHVRELNLAVGMDQTITRAVERFYQGRGVDWCAAVRRDSPLERRLLQRGYVRDYAWIKFSRDTRPAEPVDCELNVTQADERFGGVVQQGFGMPEAMVDWLVELPGRDGWHCFMAWDGDTPAAAGALHVGDEGGWLGLGAALPAYRGRGAQKALLAARIDAARALGVETLVTETGERLQGRPDASYRNILNAGFEEAYARTNLHGPRF